ncbi:MAG: DUF1353 domain-containing protein [Acidimicrobiia bacterium]|nr:DUF1353 domain-containing protein [Acidimicrobiia bacterium]
MALRQTSPTTFRTEESFTYRTAADEWTVTPEMLGDTDLASVPWPMLWFISRYGRHTLAALLHDWMVKVADVDFTSRRRADRVFFDALGFLGVATLMRVIMWAAVTIKTRWATPDRARWLRRLGLVGWSLAALWGIANFLTHLAWWNLGPLGELIGDAPPFGFSGLWLSLVLPVAVAPLWGSDAWPQGLGAVVPGAFVVPMSALTAASYGVYWLLELTVSTVWRRYGPPAPDGADYAPKTPPSARETLS